jgi:hypothetical protein
MEGLYIGLAALVMGLGAVAMVYVGRAQRAGRQEALRSVDDVLRALAAARGGEFVAGKLLYQHPVVGPIQEYGVARVVSHGLRVDVTVNYPSDHSHDDRTVLRVAAPAGRHWRVAGLKRTRAPAGQDDLAAATFDRCFKGARAGDLPDAARTRLLGLARQALALELDGEGLSMVVDVDKPWFGGVSYVADPTRLAGLVDEVARAADELLTR